MDNMPQPSLFEITELVHLIAQHLTQYEIVQCMQVSKQFALQFEPMLWEHLDFTKKTPPSEASYHNLIHIRSIKLDASHFISSAKFLTHGLQCPVEYSNTTESTSKGDLTTSTASPSLISKLPMSILPLCTNLRRINVGAWDGSCCGNIILLLLHNPGLQSIVLPSYILVSEPSDVQRFTEAISNLTCLEDMTLQHNQHRTSMESALSFIRTCLKLPRLSRLKMDYCTTWNEIEHNGFIMQMPQVLDEALTARRMATKDGVIKHKVRELVLPHTKEACSISLLVTILQSELLALETFTIPQVQEDEVQGSLDDLGDAIRQYCTRVQHLVFPNRIYGSYNNNVDRTVIKECSGGLRSIQGRRINDLASQSDAERVLWTAITHHYKTLEEIEMMEYVTLSSMDIQNALVSCTKLRRYLVNPYFGYFSSVSLNMDDVAQGDDWGCLGMKELHLMLRRNEPRPSDIVTRNEENTKVFAGAQRLYEQIGRLVELEVLVLNIRADLPFVQYDVIEDFSWDLTLSNGCLQKLSGLKNLRKLEFKGDLYSKMGQAEMEFIDAEWPRLEQIGFGHEYTMMSNMEAWKWLKERRPTLRYKEI